MVTAERPKRRSDDPRELRDRYNELCRALALSAGSNAAVADRLVAELQSLAQEIAAEPPRPDAEGEAVAESVDQPSAREGCCYRHGNVVAFRLKVKGSIPENPRLPAALNALASADVGRVSRLAVRAAAPAAREPQAPSPMAPPASQGAPARELDRLVARQGAEIEALARSVESSRELFDRLEERLAASPSAEGLAPDVAGLRAASARQGAQLVALATAVHRLAKLLAASGPPAAG